VWRCLSAALERNLGRESEREEALLSLLLIIIIFIIYHYQRLLLHNLLLFPLNRYSALCHTQHNSTSPLPSVAPR
jgi:hypothetical protein